MSCHALLQGIFPTQGSNPHLLRLLLWEVGSLSLVPRGKPIWFLNPRKSFSLWRNWCCSTEGTDLFYQQVGSQPFFRPNLNVILNFPPVFHQLPGRGTHHDGTATACIYANSAYVTVSDDFIQVCRSQHCGTSPWCWKQARGSNSAAVAKGAYSIITCSSRQWPEKVPCLVLVISTKEDKRQRNEEWFPQNGICLIWDQNTAFWRHI